MPSCLQVFTSDAATVRQSFSFSITHGPAKRNRRPFVLRCFQMAAESGTRQSSGGAQESKWRVEDCYRQIWRTTIVNLNGWLICHTLLEPNKKCQQREKQLKISTAQSQCIAACRQIALRSMSRLRRHTSKQRHSGLETAQLPNSRIMHQRFFLSYM